ncbi:RING-H2 finger protein ATL78-like [Gossypium hirsutum]|uniref:RING-type E3 ubiquitin transferase n=1 Tax=Gossypium hirsutum TaxID=3635 RepID=A0A1U8PQK1_GOSHI|nr:RING-H2 finger protein ATL78-like [Gossypium hirsutum]
MEGTQETTKTVFPSSTTCTIVSCLGLFCVSKCGIRGSSSVAADSGVIHSAKSGVEENTLNAFPIVKYASELKLPSLDTACAICLSKFTAGEHLRILPKCNHGFHTPCIDTWLISHSSCRNCLAETDQKTNNCSQETSSSSAQHQQQHCLKCSIEAEPNAAIGFDHFVPM